MPSIILECPHCGAEKIGFQLVHDLVSTVTPPGLTKRCRTLLVCSNCEEAIIGVFDFRSGIPFPNPGQAPCQCHVDPRKMNWTLSATYPSPQPSKCPDHTPDELKRLFLQASNAQKRGDPDASGAMSRKVVDVSTQQLLGERAKEYKNIYQRIEALAKAGALTPDLKDWAHEVRLGGADAAHDLDPFTNDEAAELLVFAELYLTYVYSLPGRLKERRGRPNNA